MNGARHSRINELDFRVYTVEKVINKLIVSPGELLGYANLGDIDR